MARRVLVAIWGVMLLAGCGEPSPRTSTAQTPASTPAASQLGADDALPLPPEDASRGGGDGSEGPPPDAAAAPRGDPGPSAETAPSTSADGPSDSAPPLPPAEPREIDEARLRAAGIRRIEGPRLVLYTDAPADAQIDSLPDAFQQAYPQWCAYFGLPEETSPLWRMTGYLMRERARFQRAGLWDERLPEFPNGFYIDYEFWVQDQQSPYYRRHLALHEGTHGLMQTRLGGVGPPWYAEGMAELLATHAWRDGKLTLGHFPASRDEALDWGRVKVLREAYADRQALPLTEVLAYGPRAHLENAAYSWCWAAAALLDEHPRYRERFRGLSAWAAGDGFSGEFARRYEADWADLLEDWQVFVGEIEYGYDLERAAVEFADGEPLPAGGSTVTVAADRGWQSSRVRLEGGKSYRLRARGRYQVADQPKVWWCEPGGVSIRYYDGLPLGRLVAAVRPQRHDPGVLSALLQPQEVGLETVVAPSTDGTLYLRINDSAAELADNAGTLEVEVHEVMPE